MTFTESKSKYDHSNEISSASTTSTATLTNSNSNQDIGSDLNIWSHILQEVQNSTKKSPPPKSIILLGDNESGRSTLISRLKGVETISKGIGLEYHYIDIKDEDRDDIQKLGVWVPDGDGASSNLLKCALNENNIENSIVVFVVSMSTPWTIMESLKKWSNILKDHITKKLSINDKKRNELMKQQVRIYQQYQEPDDSNINNNVKKSKLLNLNETDKSKSNQDDKLNDNDSADNYIDEILLPLDPHVLSKNYGIPIVVIATKSDCISILDKEMEYRVEHFDFIQYHIRKFCLEYGAALFYTTVKDKRTHDKLYKYLIHKFYNYSFNYPAAVVDRESIFIPSGWDNESKINILLENSATIKSDSDYSEVIPKPSIRKPLQRDIETVHSQDDQEFLAKLQIIFNKSSTPMVKTEDMNVVQQMNLTNSTPPTIKSPHKPPAKAANAPDSNNLKNFFQNLLNKNAPSNAGGATGGTGPSSMIGIGGSTSQSSSTPNNGSNETSTSPPSQSQTPKSEQN